MASAGVTQKRTCPVRWDDLTAAFENNAPDVHSYLNLSTGHVIRVVDGAPGAAEVLARVAADPDSVRVEPVSSRDQYRWMEQFIETTESPPLRERLTAAIDGKGAFRRFKDVLLNAPEERERWFQFRQDLLKVEMDAWLAALGVEPIAVVEPDRPVEGPPMVNEGMTSRTQGPDTLRLRLHETIEAVPPRDLAAALAFLEYLRDRRQPTRARPSVRRRVDGADSIDGLPSSSPEEFVDDGDGEPVGDPQEAVPPVE